MKIVYYCQHVLGVGHFFRTLEICKALANHEIVLVSGGQPLETALPGHIQKFPLPSLMMDREFKGLIAKEKDHSIQNIKRSRRQIFFTEYKSQSPDLFLIEFYPFGRRSFSFEINPILKALRYGIFKPSGVVCSLRDILVNRKKNYQAFYENVVVDLLNTYFDAVLVHADSSVLKLDETFSRVKDISVPIVYTGFVTPKPPPGSGEKLRSKLGIEPDEIVVVGSLGGGNVGGRLLDAVMTAFEQTECAKNGRLFIFTGPFMPQKDYDRLLLRSNDRMQVMRFTSDFITYLSAADLSVSMAGYNTCMNLLAAQVPALVWPFQQNREQRLRAERLSASGFLKVLADEDLSPTRLSVIMDQVLSESQRPRYHINLDGAANTAKWIEELDRYRHTGVSI